VYTEFWRGNLRECGHLGNPGVDGRIIFRWIFRKLGVSEWTGSIWLRILILIFSDIKSILPAEGLMFLDEISSAELA
jgi:hypothetical protein